MRLLFDRKSCHGTCLEQHLTTKSKLFSDFTKNHFDFKWLRKYYCFYFWYYFTKVIHIQKVDIDTDLGMKRFENVFKDFFELFLHRFRWWIWKINRVDDNLGMLVTDLWCWRIKLLVPRNKELFNFLQVNFFRIRGYKKSDPVFWEFIF